MKEELEKRCGTCDWWDASYVSFLIGTGTCELPLPGWLQNDKRRRTTFEDCPNCMTWKLREDAQYK